MPWSASGVGQLAGMDGLGAPPVNLNQGLGLRGGGGAATALRAHEATRPATQVRSTIEMLAGMASITLLGPPSTRCGEGKHSRKNGFVKKNLLPSDSCRHFPTSASVEETVRRILRSALADEEPVGAMIRRVAHT